MFLNDVIFCGNELEFIIDGLCSLTYILGYLKSECSIIFSKFKFSEYFNQFLMLATLPKKESERVFRIEIGMATLNAMEAYLTSTSDTTLFHNEQFTDTLWNFLEVRLGMSMEMFRMKVLDVYSKIIQLDSRNTEFFILKCYLDKFMHELTKGSYKTRKSIVVILSSILIEGCNSTINYVFSNENLKLMFPQMCDMLTIMDKEIVMGALVCIEYLLKHESNQHSFESPTFIFYKEFLEKEGIVNKLEFLLDSEETGIYLTAQRILNMYFLNLDEDEVEAALIISEMERCQA